MANGTGLTFITALQNESSDCSTAEIFDLTTDYGIGSYPARNTLALYLYLYKRDVNLNDTPITVDNSSPLSVTRWSINLAGDGWYPGIVFGFLSWTAGTYSINQCVYHSGVYYKANTSTSSTPGADGTWDVITDILGTCLNIGTNVEQTQVNNFTVCNGNVKASNVLQPFGQKIINGTVRNWEDAANALYVAALIQSAVTNHRRLDDVDGQMIMDFVNNRFAA